MTAPWCGQPLPDDRDGWRTRALAFKEAAEEAEAERDAARREIERLLTALTQAERKLFECSVGHGVADHRNYPCDLPGEARLIMIEALRASGRRPGETRV